MIISAHMQAAIIIALCILALFLALAVLAALAAVFVAPQSYRREAGPILSAIAIAGFSLTFLIVMGAIR